MPVMVARVMRAVPIDTVAARHAAPAAGGGATFRAPLAAMDLHAGFHLGAVRDVLPAQPHGIRRTGLLNVLALGAGRTGRAEKNEDRQRQSAHKTHAAHKLFLLRLRCPRAKLAALAGAVDGLGRPPLALRQVTAVRPGKFPLQVGLSGGSGAQRWPHSNLPAAGPSALPILPGQRSTATLVTSAVVLSNVMRRQNEPSGMA